MRVKAMVDTGSQSSIISWKFFKRIKCETMRPTGIKLISTGGGSMLLNGVLKLEIQNENKVISQEFILVRDLVYDCIIGIDTLRLLNFKLQIGNIYLKTDDPQEENVMKIMSLKLQNTEIDTGDHKPIKDFRRRIPFFRRDVMEGLIQDMLKNNVIENLHRNEHSML